MSRNNNNRNNNREQSPSKIYKEICIEKFRDPSKGTNLTFISDRTYMGTKVSHYINNINNQSYIFFNNYSLFFKCDEPTCSKKKNLIRFPKINLLPLYIFDEHHNKWDRETIFYETQNFEKTVKDTFGVDLSSVEIKFLDQWRSYSLWSLEDKLTKTVRKGILFDSYNKTILEIGSVIPESITMNSLEEENNKITVKGVTVDISECKFYKMVQGVIINMVRLEGINVFYSNTKFFPMKSYLDIKDPSFLSLFFAGDKCLPNKIFGQEMYNNICYKWMLSHPILSGVSKVDLPENGSLSLIESIKMWDIDTCKYPLENCSIMNEPLDIYNLDKSVKNTRLISFEETKKYFNYGNKNIQFFDKYLEIFKKFPSLKDKYLPGEAILIEYNGLLIEVCSSSFNYRKEISYKSNDKYIGYLKYIDFFHGKKRKAKFLLDNLIFFKDLDFRNPTFELDINFYNSLYEHQLISENLKEEKCIPNSYKDSFFKSIDKQITMNYLFSLSNSNLKNNMDVMIKFLDEIKYIDSNRESIREKLLNFNPEKFRYTDTQTKLTSETIPKFIKFIDDFSSGYIPVHYKNTHPNGTTFVSQIKYKFNPTKIHLIYLALQNESREIYGIPDHNPNDSVPNKLINFSSGRPYVSYS